jgi:beta-1,4-glucosyltransferase
MMRNTRAGVVERFVRQRMARKQQTVVFFSNTHFIDRCHCLRDQMRRGVVVLNDGLGVDIASFLIYGAPFRENLNGTDFVPGLLSRLSAPTRVYLVGSTPRNVRAAAVAISRFPNAVVVGWRDGYSLWWDEARVIRDICERQPDMLLVGLGNPLQERWILANRERLPSAVILGVGALFDFMSGARPRAPLMLRRMRLEWAFRLAQEPHRLIGRYTIGAAHFLYLVLASTVGVG